MISDYITEDTLYAAMRKCNNGTLWKDSVAAFNLKCENEIRKLFEELSNNTYKQRRPKYFKIGKRDIMSISFRDRILQRALNDDILYPNISRSLIPANAACQTGKGTKYAKDYLVKQLRRVYVNTGSNAVYALKCDIHGYYDSIPHYIGELAIRKAVPHDVYEFVSKNVLSVYPGGKGYIAGNQAVQLIGISALNGLDHYIKEQLHIKGYTRYMDDFILLSNDRRVLEECRSIISNYLRGIGLELHPKKTKILDLSSQVIEFLGFDFKLTNTGKVCIFVASSKAKRKKRSLRKMAKKVKLGLKSRESADRAYLDWREHASYGTTSTYLKKMDEFYYSLYDEST